MVDERKDVSSIAEETTLERLTVDEVKPIMSHIQKLWDEVDQRNKTQTLNPDYDLYQVLQDSDQWFFYKATYQGLSSFYSFLIQPSLHVKGTFQLSSDFIYVNPKHRGIGIADILLLAAEDKGRSKGVTILSIGLKEFEKHDSLVKRNGYTLFENTHQKVL